MYSHGNAGRTDFQKSGDLGKGVSFVIVKIDDDSVFLRKLHDSLEQFPVFRVLKRDRIIYRNDPAAPDRSKLVLAAVDCDPDQKCPFAARFWQRQTVKEPLLCSSTAEVLF